MQKARETNKGDRDQKNITYVVTVVNKSANLPSNDSVMNELVKLSNLHNAKSDWSGVGLGVALTTPTPDRPATSSFTQAARTDAA